MITTDLSRYDNAWYRPGGFFRRSAWYVVNRVIFSSSMPYPSRVKAFLLRAFGCTVGSGPCLKPGLNIKYPWFLSMGNNVWLGENCWIDNLAQVTIGNNVCISQAAHILTGNHDYTRPGFDLVVKPVTIQDGAWVAAHAIVCPGVTMASHSVLAAGSVLTRNTEPFTVYQGNPAVAVRKRVIVA